MQRTDVMRLALEAGFKAEPGGFLWVFNTDELALLMGKAQAEVRQEIDVAHQQAIAAAVLAENEACAVLADNPGQCYRATKGRGHPALVRGIAIRARVRQMVFPDGHMS